MVKIGEKAPDFEVSDHEGQQFKLSSVLGTKPIVLIFYPASFTPVCTKEVCGFRDSMAQFNKLDCVVLGISGDDVAKQKRFHDENNLNFTLLADIGNKVRKSWNVPGAMFGMMPGRVTYVIDKAGVIRGLDDSMLDWKAHVDMAQRVLAKTQTPAQ